jgi:chromate reductase
MNVLGISGSLREGSHNRALLAAAAAELPAGVGFREWRGLETLPAYSEDREAQCTPESVSELRRSIAFSDAVLLSTPEYNHSVPGALKNALDWVSRPYERNPLRGKPAAVIGASTGVFGAVWAQAELRRILKAVGADVVETGLPLAGAATAFTANGRLKDAAAAATLRSVMRELVQRRESAAA